MKWRRQKNCRHTAPPFARGAGQGPTLPMTKAGSGQGQGRRGGSSAKILGGNGYCPLTFLHHRIHFLRSPKPKKYDLHYRPTFEIYFNLSQAVVRGTTNPAPCCHLANDSDLLTPVLWAMAGDNKQTNKRGSWEGSSEPLSISEGVYGGAL